MKRRLKQQQNRFLVVFIFLFSALLLLPSSFAAQPSSGARSPIGTNLNGLNDWSTEIPFLDLFKTSRPWFSGTAETWEDGRSLNLDEHGWVRSLEPGQIAKTLFFFYDHPYFPPGRYVVEYEGEGSLEYYFEGHGVRLAKRTPGRDFIEVDPSPDKGFGLFVTSVNPANYIRNIHVFALETPRGETFNPKFLQTLRNYKTIRFMIWMLGENAEDNNIVPHTWGERPKPDDAQWSRKGAPVEVMVALANRVGVAPWFSLPHMADDDYIKHFAETVRDLLKPGLKVYVEYSNEVWNVHDYPQGVYAQQKGLTLGLGPDPGEAGNRYYARRSKEIFEIFEKVFGGRERLVRVLASFSSMPEVSETAFKNGDIQPSDVDAIAIAPYFGYDLGLPENESRVEKMTLNELFHELETVSLPAAKNEMVLQAAVARKYGLPLISYEGGQHLKGVDSVEKNPKVNALFDAANRDPRMELLYTRYLQDWSTVTQGQLFVHLLNTGGMSPHGRWGALEYIDQPRAEAPKYDALQRFIED